MARPQITYFVQVVNQTTVVKEVPTFRPVSYIKPQSERFNEVFGDCYISGLFA